MQSALNSSDGNNQHFAVFRPMGADALRFSDTFFIGAEDLPICSSDKDFNDMVVKITNVNVPLPPSALLLATGLAGLGIQGWGRRRRS